MWPRPGSAPIVHGAFLALGALLASPAFAATCPPATRRSPVTDRYHGVTVSDDYRWLEDGKDPEVQAWSDAQNACARAYLDALPGRALLVRRLETLRGSTSPDFSSLKVVAGVVFAIENRPPKQQPFLVTLKSLDDVSSAHVVLDPNVLDPRGTTAIDWYVPSPDATRVAVSLSVGGSENGTLHVYDVATGRAVGEAIPRVQEGTGGGDAAWDQDGSGFCYTRYPRGAERPAADRDFYQQVFHHRLGTPVAQDAYVIGRDWPRIAETTLMRREDGRYLLARVANGDGGQFAFELRDPSGKWTRIAAFEDGVKRAVFGPGDTLYLLSTRDAPRGQVLRLELGEPDLAKAAVVVRESKNVVEQCLPTVRRLYVRDLRGGPSGVRIFDLEGASLGELPVPAATSVGPLVRLAEDDVLYRQESYLTPPAWYRWDAGSQAPHRTALVKTSPADFSDTEVVRTTVASKDGTEVPLTILMRTGTPLDGDNPTLLTGYGGFDISQRPGFSEARRVWIEQGGVLAIANLRGGGEFGEEWHDAGRLTRKQNVFDDFAACARALVARRYTRPARLAVQGGSNGGLLMGALLTQHPELVAAVVSRVGIYDMLRVELSPNGSFNTTEYGSVKDPTQFRALYAYSPYHHVVDGTRYPPILFLTGANDPRVDPMQSRKMLARLQAATGSKAPILLATSSRSGHGLDMALSERIGQDVDVYAFLFHALGVTPRPVP